MTAAKNTNQRTWRPKSEVPDQTLIDGLRSIEKRDWRLWGVTIFLLFVLTLTIFLVALPSIRENAKGLFNIRLGEAVLALAGLVALFVVYTIYQQVLIKRLRLQLADKQSHSEVLRNLAMVDPLTGLHNRRAGMQRLEAEVSRSSRNGNILMVVLFDLNKFKHINDTFGHPAGDLVLQEFAANLKRAIRVSDVAARMGGDEFLVILPECPTKQLNCVLKRLESLTVDFQGQIIPITFSVGWKEFRAGDNADGLVSAADEALYANKRNTRIPG